MGTMRGSGPGVGESGAREGHGSGTRRAAGARRGDRGPAPRRLQKAPRRLTAFTRGPGKGESTETESRPGAAGGCRGLRGKGRGDWLLTSAGLVLGW